jgi:hypothetical protein
VVRLHLSGNTIADTERPFALLDGEADWRTSRRDLFSNQAREVSHRATELSAKYLEQGLLLRGRSAIVDIPDSAPAAFQDVARYKHGDTEVEPRDIDAFNLTYLDAIG